MKKKIIYSSIFCMALIIIWLIIRSMNQQYPLYPLSRHIQYSFTLQNRSDRVARLVEFRTYAPVRETSTQRCDNITCSHSYSLVTDGLGNQILIFTFDEFAPYAAKVIDIGASLFLSDIPNRASVEKIESWLTAQEYCESTHPDIIMAAERLKGDRPAKTAENIFGWVRDNLEYAGFTKDARGALYALKNKRGDCTEFMYLFTALCRAGKIPSRCLGGYVLNGNAVLKPAQYHNWSEFYEDGAWRIADPQNRVFMKDQGNYIAMRIIEGANTGNYPLFNRFMVKGDGISARMN